MNVEQTYKGNCFCGAAAELPMEPINLAEAYAPLICAFTRS